MQHLSQWPCDAAALVERAVAAHGGAAQWRATSSIRLPFYSGSGLLLSLKGFAQRFPSRVNARFLPHDCVTVFHDYPDEHHRGRFVNGDVRIERLRDGEPVAESRNHRHTFGRFTKYRRWSPLDALYFFGYALWHYHVLPFTLPRAQLVRMLSRHATPVGIDVVFPADVHTHCRRQQI